MQAVKGDADKATKEIENAIQQAKSEGKEKATPKHVKTKKVKSQSFGKFYKWAEIIADSLAGKKEAHKERVHVLDKLMVGFENGQPAKQIAETYFMGLDKKKS